MNESYNSRSNNVYGAAGGAGQTNTANYGGVLPRETAAIPSPVPSALNNLTSAQERLHDRISLLTQRLDALLSPLPPSPVAETSPKLARHSLALQIEAEAHSVAHAADRVGSLIDRLEV